MVDWRVARQTARFAARVGWAEANLDTLAGLLDPIARRLDPT